jgi:formylglycine-generating enzyme required for sulfatase activity
MRAMELDDIRQRLVAVERTLTRWGLDLDESLGNLERSPSATCIQVGVVVEQMLRDLWRRLKLKGPPEKRQFEDLVTLTTKKLDEESMAMPVEILTDIRVIQSRRNQAAHFWKANRRDAEYVLGCLANVTNWYFVEFLPSREGVVQAPLPGGDGLTHAAPPLVVPAQPPKTITNTIGMTLVLISEGEFLMGSPDSDKDAYDDEKPQHRVRITQPFYLAVTPVTRGQYRAVTGADPSHFKGPDDLPVEQVSWQEARAFCDKLNALEKGQMGGANYRLPTEAEWEYACRAGTTTRFTFGDAERGLWEYAWFSENSGSETHPVGQKRPNAWGLYDMHGNVWEWCWDGYDKNYYANSPGVDPLGPSAASERVFRGGSWYFDPRYARSAFRYRNTLEFRRSDLGLRLARAQSGE